MSGNTIKPNYGKSNSSLSQKKINPDLLALLGAFITIIGDLLSFLAILTSLQDQYGDNQ